MKIFEVILKGAAVFAAPFLFPHVPAAAQEVEQAKDAPVVLPAEKGWVLDYAKDSCRVGRFFGEGKQRTLLQLTQFEPNRSFMLAIAGGGFGKRLRPGEFTLQFGPSLPAMEVKPVLGSIGDFTPGIILTETKIRDVETLEQSGRDRDQEAIATFKPDNPITAADEASAEWIEFSRNKRPVVRLDTGPMGELFKALNTCSETLLADWGLDKDRYKAKSRPPIPTISPGKWITTNDYPTKMLRESKQAIVYFRLMIDEQGMPYECHIQQSGYPKEFDDAVCKAAQRRARFQPALDADGQPMKSYYRTAVQFQTW